MLVPSIVSEGGLINTSSDGMHGHCHFVCRSLSSPAAFGAPVPGGWCSCWDTARAGVVNVQSTGWGERGVGEVPPGSPTVLQSSCQELGLQMAALIVSRSMPLRGSVYSAFCVCACSGQPPHALEPQLELVPKLLARAESQTLHCVVHAAALVISSQDPCDACLSSLSSISYGSIYLHACFSCFRTRGCQHDAIWSCLSLHAVGRYNPQLATAAVSPLQYTHCGLLGVCRPCYACDLGTLVWQAYTDPACHLACHLACGSGFFCFCAGGGRPSDAGPTQSLSSRCVDTV